MSICANFRIEKDTPKYILLKDLGPWGRFRTITNAADDVVSMVNSITPIRGRKLYYYDSDNELTELKVNNEQRFAGFGPGPRELLG
ncbi:MAG: hypothetical protein Q8O55_07410 [Dehalococcoidales bacterium]|nr:hypothetical protein [Dehalococcoidales bacterium]